MLNMRNRVWQGLGSMSAYHDRCWAQRCGAVEELDSSPRSCHFSYFGQQANEKLPKPFVEGKRFWGKALEPLQGEELDDMCCREQSNNP